MAEPATGHEYILWLKEQKDKRPQSFGKFYDGYLDYKAREKGIPIFAQLELTPLCNFDCKMCYVHLTKEQMKGVSLLTVEEWKQLIHDAWEAGLIRVNLTGGECLSYPGFEELYLYLHSLGCEIRVLTNGALLDEHWTAFFKAHPPILIQISLYGGDEETYENVTGRRVFSTVAANIRRVRDAGLPLLLAITPSKYMRGGMEETIRAAKSFDVPYFINPFLINPKEDTGRSGQDHDLTIDEYVDLLRFRNELDGVENRSIDPELLPPPGGPHRECSECGLTCTAGMSSFDIGWDGMMYPCNSYLFKAGYPLKEGFLSCWNKLHQKAVSWRRVPECIECPYEPVCTTCLVRKAEFAGPGKQPLELCERTRYMVQHGVYSIPECP